MPVQPDDLYRSLFENFLLSPGQLHDVKNAAAGSHVEAFHIEIFNRQIIIKNKPINTVYGGNKVSFLHVLIKNGHFTLYLVPIYQWKTYLESFFPWNFRKTHV